MYKLQRPENEKVLSYEKGCAERERLSEALAYLSSMEKEIPLVIDGKEIFTQEKREIRMPHDHKHVLGRYSLAQEEHVSLAIEAALSAKKTWDAMTWAHRASVFLKAADLASSKYRHLLNAATMLGQSKNAYQAEIDSACELIDFFRFSAYYMAQIYKEQASSSGENWNRVDYRSLEGFVYAVSPFNFTAIGANLVTAPAIVGNTVLWKPAQTAVYSNYLVMQILMEAGLPKGVINFIPGDSAMITDYVLESNMFAGLHYTGSTAIFNMMWKKIAQNIENYRMYPRLVGETGGKNFVFAHHSADVEQLSTALIRGAFEYQGQKCSAASRAYIPQSLWPQLKNKLIQDTQNIKYGDVKDFSNFMNAVIDRKSFDKIKNYIENAKASQEAEIILGGTYDDSVGYFIAPTIIQSFSTHYETMEEEIFGPILTLYVYPDEEFEAYMDICEFTGEYALTGAIFAKDRIILNQMERALRNAAGNLYINDKPTGAVVDQQPFGGARKSGTNDKAGSKINLKRWLSPRVIKENFNPPVEYPYSFMK